MQATTGVSGRARSSLQQLPIDFGDSTDVTERRIYRFGGEEVRVPPGETYRAADLLRQNLAELGQGALDNRQARVVCNSQPAHERAGDSRFGERLADKGTAAVHDNWRVGLSQLGDFRRDLNAQRSVGHGVAAIFDDDGRESRHGSILNEREG